MDKQNFKKIMKIVIVSVIGCFFVLFIPWLMNTLVNLYKVSVFYSIQHFWEAMVEKDISFVYMRTVNSTQLALCDIY